MQTLTKLAGYENDRLEKIAGAMDYLESNNIDPIGAFTLALNVNENGQIVDEKVAAEAAELTDADFQKIAEAVEHIGGLDKEAADEILKIATVADAIEKVAAVSDALLSAGIDPESAFIIASSVDEQGNIVDEKVASEIGAAGFTEQDFDKIAEAVQELAESGLTPEDALAILPHLVEA